MEEQEKIDIREHLIGWIDTFLEDGIVPQVVNPKAIRTNYIPKSKVKEKIEELKKAGTSKICDNENNVIEEHYFLQDEIDILQELLGDEE